MTALEAAKLNINDELITLIDTPLGPKGTKVYYQGAGSSATGVWVMDAIGSPAMVMFIDDLMHVPSLVVSGAMVSISRAEAARIFPAKMTTNSGDCYWHTWAKYAGFTEIYEYCTSCGVKSFSDK